MKPGFQLIPNVFILLIILDDCKEIETNTTIVQVILLSTLYLCMRRMGLFCSMCMCNFTDILNIQSFVLSFPCHSSVRDNRFFVVIAIAQY